MTIQKYNVNQVTIQTLISWIQANEIAIPEIQRPFVWKATQVRDLLDSLFKGYPIGYLIAWKNPDVRLKDGTRSVGKKILIDGQQRVTAIISSLLAKPIITKDYKKARIIISYNPLENVFEVANPAIKKNKTWISDISVIFKPDFKILQFVRTFCSLNGIGADNMDLIHERIDSLRGILNNPVGIIELNSDLDIETVTEIFIRINSSGTELSQADFAMSKIAANERHNGNVLRKAIDYFCHLAVAPEFYDQVLELEKDFAKTQYFKAMTWLRHENDDIYDPSYTDMLRVSFTSEFKRGKLEDLVALLSGRNFETREYEEQIEEDSFRRMGKAILKFMNETNFKRFVMIVRSAGFISSSMIRSQNALNVAYILYLTLRDQKENPPKIEHLVRRWFVLSVLTSRYSGSPESTIDYDIKQIYELGAEKYISLVESAELSDAFWNFALPEQLNTSVANSPSFKVFLAAQVKMRDNGFLSSDITVSDLIMNKGDVHHIFPKELMKKHGHTRSSYNQVANYVITQSEINIRISNKTPYEYFSEIFSQCESGIPKYGGITDRSILEKNLAMHCIPQDLSLLKLENYFSFLEKRRKMMAEKIRDYYQML